MSLSEALWSTAGIFALLALGWTFVIMLKDAGGDVTLPYKVTGAVLLFGGAAFAIAGIWSAVSA